MTGQTCEWCESPIDAINIPCEHCGYTHTIEVKSWMCDEDYHENMPTTFHIAVTRSVREELEMYPHDWEEDFRNMLNECDSIDGEVKFIEKLHHLAKRDAEEPRKPGTTQVSEFTARM